jgi:ubiquinone/menaquinone biosynthesis C-methylase UbiE
MNIEDKRGLFGEMRRVTRRGGRLAFFDILAGPEQPIHFPVPWAESAATSFLASIDTTREVLAQSGWTIRVWTDVTEEAAKFYDQLASAPPSAPSPLGLHLLIPNMPAKGANLRRNVDEGRIRIVRCVADAV